MIHTCAEVFDYVLCSVTFKQVMDLDLNYSTQISVKAINDLTVKEVRTV